MTTRSGIHTEFNDRSGPPARPGRKIFIAAAAVYYLAATFLHDPVSEMYSAVFKVFGRTAMEGALQAASLVLAAGALATAWNKVRRGGKPVMGPALLWAAGLALAAAADAWLVVTNIERVHYPQYAVLALLLAPAAPGYLTVLVICAAAGAFDELMQYVMFPEYTKYLDFNDFVLNLVGAGLGLALHASLTASARNFVSPRAADFKAVLAALFLAVALLAGGRAGFIAQTAPVKDGYPLVQEVGGKQAFVLSFRTERDFWVRAEHGRIYHILSPVEGVSVLAGIIGSYALLFALLNRLKSAGQSK